MRAETISYEEYTQPASFLSTTARCKKLIQFTIRLVVIKKSAQFGYIHSWMSLKTPKYQLAYS
jgi:hypothetical protein